MEECLICGKQCKWLCKGCLLSSYCSEKCRLADLPHHATLCKLRQRFWKPTMVDAEQGTTSMKRRREDEEDAPRKRHEPEPPQWMPFPDVVEEKKEGATQKDIEQELRLSRRFMGIANYQRALAFLAGSHQRTGKDSFANPSDQIQKNIIFRAFAESVIFYTQNDDDGVAPKYDMVKLFTGGITEKIKRFIIPVDLENFLFFEKFV
jgi:hypothetical protein